MAADNDSFLDRPMENIDPIKVTSFTDWVEKMQKFSGKKVILPEGVADLLKNHREIDARFQTTIGQEGGGKVKNFSARQFLEDLGDFSGMAGHYDAGKDAIVLEFQNKSDDPRPNAELVKILLETKPQRIDYSSSDPQGKSDPWHAAFEGLIGKTENRVCASLVQWTANLQDELASYSPVTNVFSGNILDEKGAPHLLIINSFGGSTMPGGTYVIYYLFNQNGKIEEGGVMNAGGIHMGPPAYYVLTIKLDDTKTRLACHQGSIDLVLAVEKGHLVTVERLDSGKPAEPPKENVIGHSLGKMILKLDGG